MKKLIVGFVIGFLSLPLANDFVEIASFLTKRENKTIQKLWRLGVYPKYGFSKPFVKQCTKDVSENGHGWVFVRRQYNECGKTSILISDFLYGEYTKPRNPELEAKACKSCNL